MPSPIAAPLFCRFEDLQIAQAHQCRHGLTMAGDNQPVIGGGDVIQKRAPILAEFAAACSDMHEAPRVYVILRTLPHKG
jgi:hypothetical protein